MIEAAKPATAPGIIKQKTREEKYAEEVLKLHEAYQV
jgi:hypothetical protein